MSEFKWFHVTVSTALVALAAFGAAPATAEVDRSPRPSGVYKLKPGIFVAQGTDCQNPPNAALKLYDGRGISTAHTRSCIARVISKRRNGHGSIYIVSQSCIDAGSGPGKRFVERQTVDVPDALNFTIRSDGSPAYRYCTIRDLPIELRKMANQAERGR